MAEIRIEHLHKAFGGFTAETAGGLTLVMNAVFGIPVSTTHTITGAIVSANRKDAVSNNVDSMEQKATITYDCPAMQDPGGLGLIPRTWSIQPGSYREIAG